MKASLQEAFQLLLEGYETGIFVEWEDAIAGKPGSHSRTQSNVGAGLARDEARSGAEGLRSRGANPVGSADL